MASVPPRLRCLRLRTESPAERLDHLGLPGLSTIPSRNRSAPTNPDLGSARYPAGSLGSYSPGPASDSCGEPLQVTLGPRLVTGVGWLRSAAYPAALPVDLESAPRTRNWTWNQTPANVVEQYALPLREAGAGVRSCCCLLQHFRIFRLPCGPNNRLDINFVKGWSEDCHSCRAAVAHREQA